MCHDPIKTLFKWYNRKILLFKLYYGSDHWRSFCAILHVSDFYNRFVCTECERPLFKTSSCSTPSSHYRFLTIVFSSRPPFSSSPFKAAALYFCRFCFPSTVVKNLWKSLIFQHLKNRANNWCIGGISIQIRNVK